MNRTVQETFREYIQDIVDGERVSLINIQNGAAVEAFDIELKKVIQNCCDINTAQGNRSITLKVTVTPNKARTGVKFLIDCKSTSLGMESIEDEADISIDARGGGPFAKRRQSALQEPLFGGKVQPMRKE